MPFKTVNNVRFYTFDSFASHLGVTNVTTTRHAGVSPPPFDSLNLGLSTEDDPDNVAANRARLAALTSLGAGAPIYAGQVHADGVARVGAGDFGKRVDSTDALITGEADVPLMIVVADCVPVSLYDPIKKAVGLAHAGWRGTAAGVVTKTVERMMDEFGTDPTDLVAGIGPSIGPCCYEVGPDVVDAFYSRQPLIADHVLADPDTASAGSFAGGLNEDRKMLDLWRAAALQLVTAGVFEANIDQSNRCTACNPGDFYSYRAGGGQTGRFAALMMLHEKTKRSY